MGNSTGEAGDVKFSSDYEIRSQDKQDSQEKQKMIEFTSEESCRAILETLRLNGKRFRSDHNQPGLLNRPSWFDSAMFENAKSVYARHFMAINFAHLSGLILLVRITSIHNTLSSTGKSDSVSKLFRRYYQTLVHVKQWYEGDIFEPGSRAHQSLLIVRGMHNKVSAKLNAAQQTTNTTSGQADDPNGSTRLPSGQSRRDVNGNFDAQQVHISQYDIMLTQFAFVGFIVTRAKHVGLIKEFTQYDLESLLHFWRVIGHYLGASDECNLCSRKLSDTIKLCETIMELELKRSTLENLSSSPPAVMSLNIVRSLKFIPMLTFYGITRYLFELMDLDASHLEAKSTRYSRLSYTLIKLVMSHLLAYRPLRWFNNGLTRLSIFCVGKVEAWFAGRLNGRYGEELKT